MNEEVMSYVGLAYVTIGAAHLAVYAVKMFRRGEFGDVISPFVVAFAWPLVDYLMLKNWRNS